MITNNLHSAYGQLDKPLVLFDEKPHVSHGPRPPGTLYLKHQIANKLTIIEIAQSCNILQSTIFLEALDPGDSGYSTYCRSHPDIHTVVEINQK